MEKQEQRFDTAGNRKTEKILITQTRILPNGTCEHKIDWNNLTPEQHAKMVVSLINNLTAQVFDRLGNINGETNISLL